MNGQGIQETMMNLYKFGNFITRGPSVISIAIKDSALRLIIIVVLGFLSQACSNSADIVDPPKIDTSELISSSALEDSGFMGLVPLLEARASINLPSEIADSELSPDGSQIAFAQVKYDDATDRYDTMVSIYSTADGELIRSLRADESLEFSSTITMAWSDNTTLHAFHSLFAPITGAYWVNWNTANGSVLQSQIFDKGLGCDNFKHADLGVSHSGLQAMWYVTNLSVAADASYLCRLDLHDYSRTGTQLSFQLSNGTLQVISFVTSADGSKIFLRGRDNTHEIDTTTLQETREPYPDSHGTIWLSTADYSIVRVRTGPYMLLPGNKPIDSIGGALSASESGNVAAMGINDGRQYIRFIAFPGGVVIGDVPEEGTTVISNSHRHISVDGSIATVEDNGVLHVYDLSSRTNITVFPPSN